MREFMFVKISPMGEFMFAKFDLQNAPGNSEKNT